MSPLKVSGARRMASKAITRASAQIWCTAPYSCAFHNGHSVALTVGQNHGADKGKWVFAFAFAMMTLFFLPHLIDYAEMCIECTFEFTCHQRQLASVVFLTCLYLSLI